MQDAREELRSRRGAERAVEAKRREPRVLRTKTLMYTLADFKDES